MNGEAHAGLPRLLAGLRSGRAMSIADHEGAHGPLPRVAGAELMEEVELSGLRGRGGADFPTAQKLRAVAQRGRERMVVVNGSETEPASGKDALLLSRLPHLVLDGTVLAARAIGAREAIVKLPEDAEAQAAAIYDALEERQDRDVAISLALGPGGYVTGEESAVVRSIDGGPPLPGFVPPRPYERGVRGRPTLVQNPETLAQIALVARFGHRWYRELGTAADPGSALVTIGGAVEAPGVYELAFGTSMTSLVEAAGGSVEPLQALLVGGYFGTWIRAEPAMRLRLSREDLRGAGAALGSGVIIALGRSACGLHESARVLEYLSAQSAGQCGPCVFGLAELAERFRAVVEGSASGNEVGEIRVVMDEVRGRGACHHPGGVIRFLESSLRVFGPELREHGRGRCRARPAGLPVAPPTAAAGGLAPRRRREMLRGRIADFGTRVA